MSVCVSLVLYFSLSILILTAIQLHISILLITLIEYIYSDGGGEFQNREITQYYESNGIKYTYSPPNRQSRNGLIN